MSKVSDRLSAAGAGCIKLAVVCLLLALGLVVSVPLFILHMIRDVPLRIQFYRAARRGKFVVFVYSDSPNWKPRIEADVLPRIQDHAIVLNWSERSRWDAASWPVRAFEHWGGQEDFNPLALVFCGLTRVRVFRFYRAFQDFKHAKEAPLRKVEAELFELVKQHSGKR